MTTRLVGEMVARPTHAAACTAAMASPRADVERDAAEAPAAAGTAQVDALQL
jgi:hypothetical protein